MLNSKNWLPGTPSEVQTDHLEGDDQKAPEKSTNTDIASCYESNVYNSAGIADLKLTLFKYFNITSGPLLVDMMFQIG